MRNLPANRRLLTTLARALLGVGVLVFACVVPTHAQDEEVRHGFWWGMGLGYGLASFSCDSCSHAPFSGWTLFGNLGLTPSPHVRLGVEGDFWENGLRKGKMPTIDTWTVLLSYYPRVLGGPYVQGGVGLSHYGLEHGTGDPLESVSHDPAYAAAMGWGYTLGVGWEGRPVEGVAAGIVRVTYAHGNVGALYGGGTGATAWKQNVVLVQVGAVLP